MSQGMLYLFLGFIGVVFHLTTAAPGTQSPLNVLFIISDDLRPELGCYMKKTKELRHLNHDIKTPNVDGLASRSMLFTHAFSQYPLCNPSRSSLLTGRMPRVTEVFGNEKSFKETANFRTLPKYFEEKGYTTLHTGKVFHAFDDFDYKEQWQRDQERLYLRGFNKTYRKTQSKNIWSMLDNDFELSERLPYNDLRTEHALHFLQNLKNNSSQNKKPFFLGVGFLTNHLPLEAPKRFFDMYPADSIKPPPNYFKPKNFPSAARIGYCGMASYEDLYQDGIRAYSERNGIKEEMTRTLRRAYYSTISWFDYLLGRILDGLRETGFHKNTIVVMTSDHGFHLGENNHWCKLKLLDIDLRVPLLIHVPGVTDKGRTSNEVVELLDLYPTVADLAGIALPEKCPLHGNLNTRCVEGKSLKYIFKDNGNSRSNKPMDDDRYAFSVVTRKNHTVLGYSVRDHKFRYNEWYRFDKKTYCPNFDEPLGKELYDISNDPENNVNVANSEQYKLDCEKYSTLLRESWGGDCQNKRGLSESENKQGLLENKNKQGLSENKNKQGLSENKNKQGLSENKNKQGLLENKNKQGLPDNQNSISKRNIASGEHLTNKAEKAHLSRLSSGAETKPICKASVNGWVLFQACLCTAVIFVFIWKMKKWVKHCW